MPFTALLTASMVVAMTPPPGSTPELLTVAEASDYQATATHEQVMTLLREIHARSQGTTLIEFGRSFEERALPLMIIADPSVRSAQEARDSGRTVVLAIGNIHAGEVCGKEALLMLAREVALTPDHPLLDDLVILLAPIYNVDGNERMSPDNRPGQLGPAQGMGVRPNAQGLDLNRDWIKLEAPESQAMVRLLSEWDPQLTIDTHTTNGSLHRYILTYAAPLNPSGFMPSIEFVRDELLPTVTQRLRERTGYDTFFYGNFNRDRSVWATYSALPRFGGPYQGLRGQMSILSEAYAYAPYRDRVLATLEFTREIFSYAAESGGRIRDLHEQAKRAVTQAGRDPQPDDCVGIRHRAVAFEEPAIVRGYEPLPEEGEAASEAIPRDYRAVHAGCFEATRSVRRPFAYIIEAGHDAHDPHEAVVEKLRQHGVAVQPFAGRAVVETYTVRAIDRSEREFEGHHLVSIEVQSRRSARMFDDGAALVLLAQPLGNLIVYLLEPESEDGLVAWGLFNDAIVVDGEFPVHRVQFSEDLEGEEPENSRARELED